MAFRPPTFLGRDARDREAGCRIFAIQIPIGGTGQLRTNGPRKAISRFRPKSIKV
jgi:hypothetical protein